MYKIIGADQKEYGPVSGDQLRQWIREGRVNAETQACAEGSEAWQPLSAFPEFASVLTPGVPGAPPISMAAFPTGTGAGGGREAALQALKAPAIALQVTAIIGLILVALGLVINILSLMGHTLGGMQQLGDPQMQRMFNRFGGGFGILQDIIGGVAGVVIFMGASKMRSLEKYSFAVTASILAMVPCVSPCCFLGLPFGIWALIVLNKPEVKSHFS